MPTRMDDLVVSGTLKAPDTAISQQTRGTILTQEDLVRFPVPLTSLRVFDAPATNLPGTAASDDLALLQGVIGTAQPKISAGDLKAAGSTTRRARFFAVVPECYVAGQTFAIVLAAGMTTTVSDGSCSIDLEAYQLDKIGGISADLCATAGMTMNSLVFGDKTFQITPATLTPGAVLDCMLTIVCADTATATAVIPTVASIDVACDIKG